MRMLPAHFDGLFGQEVLEERGVWLALDPHGYPVLLLTPLQADERSDIELRALSVRFARACEITTENGRLVSGTFTIVRLEENDPDLVRLFLKLLEEAFCTSRRPPTNRSIAEQILEIAELASALVV